jgi:hypothetical protein
MAVRADFLITDVGNEIRRRRKRFLRSCVSIRSPDGCRLKRRPTPQPTSRVARSPAISPMRQAAPDGSGMIAAADSKLTPPSLLRTANLTQSGLLDQCLLVPSRPVSDEGHHFSPTKRGFMHYHNPTARSFKVRHHCGFVVESSRGRLVITAGHCLPSQAPCDIRIYDEYKRTYPALLGPMGRMRRS